MSELERETAQVQTIASSQFAALEPSWAGIRSATQLRCLLVLGALFNRRLYVHDTQLADNPHLLNAYVHRHDYILNLYALITDLIRSGIIVVGLRDGTYMYQTDEVIFTSSLEGLVRSWEERDASTSWVVAPTSRARRGLVRELDKLLDDENTRLMRYSYRDIKASFMRQARDTFSAENSELRHMVTQRGLDFAHDYEDILNKPWFSHSSVFSLMQVAGVPLSDPLAQIHGMFDEAAYARWQGARLLGCDWSGTQSESPEKLLGNAVESKRAEAQSLSEQSLTRQALRIVDGPGADLIASLTGNEILELRRYADELFKLQEIYEAPASGAVTATTFEDTIGDAAAAYWDNLCSYLRRTRPNMTRQRTRIGIFMRKNLPSISRVAEKFVTVGLSSIVRVALDLIPGTGSLSDASRDIIAQHFSLDFVFFSESPGLKELRSSLPTRGWVAPDMRHIDTPSIEALLDTSGDQV